jgi:hypothetical protein
MFGVNADNAVAAIVGNDSNFALAARRVSTTRKE